MNLKRLGILVFFDKDGIVDDYVDYLLADLIKNLDRLIIVCNGVLSDGGRETLNKYTDEIFIRENKGFDAAAWKYVLVEKLGWEQLDTYDELVLLNDTFYGPFYPFADMFAKMEKQNVDFWGLTIHGKTPDGWGLCEYGYLPEHIQSYFTVYRAKLIHSSLFKEYWEKMPTAKNFAEAVCFNEARQTKYFSDAGFTYGVLCDTRGIEQGYGYSDCHYIYNPLALIEIYKCPVLKRKTLITDKEFLLGVNHASAPMETLGYIERNTDYDTNLIYKYLIRTVDPLFLPEILNLNYIPEALPHRPSELRTVIVACITRKNSARLFLEYLNYARGIADWIIYVSDMEIEDMCRQVLGTDHLKIILVNSGKPEIFFGNTILEELKAYDLIGLFDDELFKEGENRVFSSDLAAADNVWRNLLKSKYYIENIITLFAEKKYLGALTHPIAYNGENMWNLFYRWKCSPDSLDNKIRPKLEKLYTQRPILSDGNMWIRKEAAMVLCSESYHDAVSGLDITKDSERQLALNLFPYQLQKKGMYIANAINAEFISATINNQILIMGNIVKPRSKASAKKTIKLLLKAFLPPRVVGWLKKVRSSFRRMH